MKTKENHMNNEKSTDKTQRIKNKLKEKLENLWLLGLGEKGETSPQTRLGHRYIYLHISIYIYMFMYIYN